MAKKNSKYWQGRFEQLEKASHQEALQTYSGIENTYIKTQKEIERQINNWYVRFAENNQLSITDAKKLLNSEELKEFKWDVKEYIKYGHENELNANWMKELENASAKFHISRLEALKIQTQQSMEALFGNQLDAVDKMASKVYTNNYYHSIYEIQKGFNVGYEVASIDNKLSKIVSKPWAVDELNFSQRIWKNKTTLTNELHQQLTRMCLTGETPEKTINYLSKKFNTSKARAGNLVMTESAYFSSLAQLDCFKELDVEKYEIVATLDSRTSSICQEQDGNVYNLKDFQPGVTAPPFHNYCRSTTVPYFDDDDYGVKGERAARDENGKTYYVSDDMKYDDWYKKYVNEQPKQETLKNNIKNGTINYKQLNINSPELKKMQEQSDKLYDGMTLEEKKAIDYYTQGLYKDINENLRGGKTPFDELISDWVKEIDSLMNRSKLDDDLILFRGVDKTLYDNWNVGDIKTESYYYSTSYDEKVATDFSEHYGNKNFLLEIKTPKNTKGIFVGKNSNSGFDEGEFLINRNTTYKVISRTENKLVLEVIE